MAANPVDPERRSPRRSRWPRRLLILLAAMLGGLVGLTPLVSGRQEAAPNPVSNESASPMHTLRNPDGSWKYTNDLVDSSSPYLLQHAHNPVDWREWGEDAFEIARREDKPILVSIGYSTCYWCHVMERQVFENPEIAELMNQWFVCVKVDREQRPDVDEIYMLATQLQTQQGGWPNNVFLTPDLKPFFAGTYFGPEDQHGRPGFPTVLRGLHDAWTERRDEVEQAAENFTDAIREILEGQVGAADGELPDAGVVDQVMSGIERSADPRYGGFGAAPKFPQETMLLFLLDRGGADRRAIVEKALERMAMGGIFDQIGGGFSRYSVDAQWHVPHFEKMLYNQALLTRAYAAAYQCSNDAQHRRVVERTLEFVTREMTGPQGQFYSALDAESDATEGKFYTWTEEEIRDTLSEGQSVLFLDVYGLAPVPEIPGHRHPEGGVVHWKKTPAETASDLGMPVSDLHEKLDEIHSALLDRRESRERPLLDDKVISGWNGLMIHALAEAGAVFDEPAYLRAAERAARFVLDEMRRDDGGLWRINRAGDNEIDAFQEDYAFLAGGLLALHRAAGDQQWLDAGAEIIAAMNRRFASDNGAYYLTSEQGELIARTMSPTEGAIPSGNAAAVHALLDLHEQAGDPAPLNQARTVLDAFSSLMRENPGGQVHMVHALGRLLRLTGDASDDLKQDRPADFIDRPAAADAPRRPGGTDSAAHVKTTGFASVSAVRPGDHFRVALQFDMDDGWHINAHERVGSGLLPTTVEPLVEHPFEVVSISYPEAQELDAAFADQPVRVFTGRSRVIIELAVSEDWKLDPDDPIASLRIAYTFQACSDDACLAPARGVEVIELLAKQRDAEIRPRNEEIFAR